MCISEELQRIGIELDCIDKVMELLELALQQPAATMEHAISSMNLLRKKMGDIGKQLEVIFEAVEKKEELESLMNDFIE